MKWGIYDEVEQSFTEDTFWTKKDAERIRVELLDSLLNSAVAHAVEEAKAKGLLWPKGQMQPETLTMATREKLKTQYTVKKITKEGAK